MPGNYQLPNPTAPDTSSGLASLPVRQNLQSLRDQINNADGAALQSKTVVEAALADAINPRLFRTQSGLGNFVVSGMLMSVPASSLSVSLPAGTAYVNGYLTSYAGGTITVSASQDTYVDLKSDGTTVQQGVTNGTASPSLTAGNIRLAKIVSNATQITAITQAGMDSQENIIFPKSVLARTNQSLPVVAALGKASDAAISSATWTAVVFDASHYNTGFAVSAANITLPFTGLYRFIVHIAYSGTANVDTLAGLSIGSGGEGAPNMPWSRIATPAVTPYVELNLIHSATAGQVAKGWAYMGGTPTIKGGGYGGGDCSYINIEYLGPIS